jgi:hypothetical protein
MKEDILEQLIEDYYVSLPGWFVKHNIKFRPSKEHPDYISKKDSVHSDLDILALNGLKIKEKIDRVHVISCKSWQEGFGINDWLSALEGEAIYKERSENFQRRELWKYFRELVSDKWIESFLNILESETGQKDFTYVIAITKLKEKDNDVNLLEKSEVIKNRFLKKNSNMKIRILTLETIINEIKKRIENKETPVTETTDAGRMIQLFHAAKILSE